MPKKSMIEHFSVIPDHRVNRTKKHSLLDILVISVCGFICKCETWVDIEEYGLANYGWLKTFLPLKHGIPSHDTFGRVFAKIDPDYFNKVFQRWVIDTFDITDGEIISIDGKYFRGTASDGNSVSRPKEIRGTVNAWATIAGVALAHKRTNFKDKTEQKVFKELIDILEVKGCIVTMDAAGCHSETVNTVLDKGGDFCVALKRNQKTMYRNIQEVFERNKDQIDVFETSEKGHGRIEKRSYYSVNVDSTFQDLLLKRSKQRDTVPWKKITSVTKVISERSTKDKSSVEERYYLSSLPADAKRLGHIIRSHWHIENKLHWCLDVAFEEDRSTVRSGYGSENMSLLRKFCLNLIKKENTSKRSVNGKRLKCCWQREYLLKVLYGVTAN